MADILAHQIDGVSEVQDDTETSNGHGSPSALREAAQLLLATDQTLRSGVHVSLEDGHLMLDGEVNSLVQRNWAEQLVASAGGEIHSRLKVVPSAVPAEGGAKPPEVDDESLQALVLFRLRLVRETEHLPVRVKANGGVVSLQGKVRTEALRQRVENLSRSTLGLRELRSSLAITR
jgi:osmotically-inducible protein OsmY